MLPCTLSGSKGSCPGSSGLHGQHTTIVIDAHIHKYVRSEQAFLKVRIALAMRLAHYETVNLL